MAKMKLDPREQEEKELKKRLGEIKAAIRALKKARGTRASILLSHRLSEVGGTSQKIASKRYGVFIEQAEEAAKASAAMRRLANRRYGLDLRVILAAIQSLLAEKT